MTKNLITSSVRYVSKSGKNLMKNEKNLIEELDKFLDSEDFNIRETKAQETLNDWLYLHHKTNDILNFHNSLDSIHKEMDLSNSFNKKKNNYYGATLKNIVNVWKNITEINVTKLSDFEKNTLEAILRNFVDKNGSLLKNTKDNLKKMIQLYLPIEEHEIYEQKQEEEEKVWKDILTENLTSFSLEFIKNIDKFIIEKNLIEAPYSLEDHIVLWKDLTLYFCDIEGKKSNLKNVTKDFIKYSGKKENPNKIIGGFIKDPTGIHLLPYVISDKILPKKIYESGDSLLIETYEKFLPRLKSYDFSENSVPEHIKSYEKAAAEYLNERIGFDSKKLEKTEGSIVKIQRIFRGEQRKKEEKKLIENKLHKQLHKKLSVKEIIDSKNNIYLPNCEQFFPGLAHKLIEAAKQIKPFSNSLKHLTATSTIDKILDEGLKGRQTLLAEGKVFREAALESVDMKNGDSNVACLSLGKIDPNCNQHFTTELVLDFQKFMLDNEGNPCLFFKQKDLGYGFQEKRKLTVGDTNLHFDHTKPLRKSKFMNTGIEFYDPNSYKILADSFIFNFLLISSNMKEIYPILAMNFFRYLDSIYNCKEPEEFRKKIYEAFSKLNKEQLISTLKDLTEKAADTMEFNIYGCTGVDMKYIKEINVCYGTISYGKYSLNMENFIDALKTGNQAKLNEVLEKIPELFKSYKFIDHLLKNIEGLEGAKDIKATLLDLKTKIELPLWKEAFKEFWKLSEYSSELQKEVLESKALGHVQGNLDELD